ncbi:hypothetical protein LINPERPRIM_LOCUS37776, partial [Linum perenne]
MSYSCNGLTLTGSYERHAPIIRLTVQFDVL